MRRARIVLIAVYVVAPLSISAVSYGQTTSSKLTAKPGYVRMPSVNITKVSPPSTSIRFVLPAGKTSTHGLFLNDANSAGSSGNASKHGTSGGVPNLVGLNTVPTFTGAFASQSPTIDFFQSPDGLSTILHS